MTQITDYRLLPEDVTGHTMVGWYDHGDGRFCMFHSRLGMWTFECKYECLREHK